eukprot:2892601-Rhodomonas_salina.1
MPPSKVLASSWRSSEGSSATGNSSSSLPRRSWRRICGLITPSPCPTTTSPSAPPATAFCLNTCAQRVIEC